MTVCVVPMDGTMRICRRLGLGVSQYERWGWLTAISMPKFLCPGVINERVGPGDSDSVEEARVNRARLSTHGGHTVGKEGENGFGAKFVQRRARRPLAIRHAPTHGPLLARTPGAAPPLHLQQRARRRTRSTTRNSSATPTNGALRVAPRPSVSGRSTYISVCLRRFVNATWDLQTVASRATMPSYLSSLRRHSCGVSPSNRHRGGV